MTQPHDDRPHNSIAVGTARSAPRRCQVTVEYDLELGSQGVGREVRAFGTAPRARKFYMEMAMAGRNPRIIRAIND